MRHAGHFSFSLALLRELLGLPEDAIISEAKMAAEQDERLTVYVEHPDLPAVGGEPSPEISPVWERDASNERVIWHILSNS